MLLWHSFGLVFGILIMFELVAQAYQRVTVNATVVGSIFSRGNELFIIFVYSLRIPINTQ